MKDCNSTKLNICSNLNFATLKPLFQKSLSNWVLITRSFPETIIQNYDMITCWLWIGARIKITNVSSSFDATISSVLDSSPPLPPNTLLTSKKQGHYESFCLIKLVYRLFLSVHSLIILNLCPQPMFSGSSILTWGMVTL